MKYLKYRRCLFTVLLLILCSLFSVKESHAQVDFIEVEDSTSVAMKRFSTNLNYNYNTRELVRRSYLEYPELELRYRFFGRDLVNVGAGISGFYYHTEHNPNLAQVHFIDFQPHVFLELNFLDLARVWISVGDRIRKSYLTNIPEPKDAITINYDDESLFHHLNFSSGATIDFARTFFIQLQIDYSLYEYQIKTDISETRVDSYYKLGFGLRF